MTATRKNFRSLQRQLEGWDTRLRLQESVVWLPRGVLAGLGAGLLLALAARLWPILQQSALIQLGALLAVIGAVTALLGVWLWRRTPVQLARRFDRMFDLEERLVTAVEIADGALPVESAVLARLQLERALAFAGRVEAGGYLRPRPDWRWWTGALAGAAALALVILLPNGQDAELARRAEVDQAMTEAVEELERLRADALADEALTTEEQAAVVETLDEAIDTLNQSGVTQEEALAALDQAQQELRDLSEQFAAERQEALEGASDLLNDTAAQEAAEALAAGDLAGAADALENLDLDSMTPEEQQALAEALQSAAGELAGSDPELAESLGEAGEALESGDTAGAESALGEAAGDLAESAGGQTAEVEGYADGVGRGQSGVAEAGRGQANQPGQGGMGQAPGGQGSSQQPGQGQGSGSGRGEGDGVEDAGGAGGPMEQDNGAGDGGESIFESIFAPQRVGGEGGEDVNIPGDPDAGVPTGTEGDFADNPDGSSTVPYNEVWQMYQDVINQALDGGYVPLGLRGLIRQYFSSLQPD